MIHCCHETVCGSILELPNYKTLRIFLSKRIAFLTAATPHSFQMCGTDSSQKHVELYSSNGNVPQVIFRYCNVRLHGPGVA